MARSRQQLMSGYDAWRKTLNPLRSLTIQRAVQLLEQGEEGIFADLQYTYDFLEKNDSDLLAIVERRTSAIVEMDWNIKIVSQEKSGFDEKLAADQQAALREAYERIDNLYEAIEHFEMSAFRGFAHVNPHRSKDAAITHLEPLDQWNFTRDGRYGAWYWNPEAKDVPARNLGEEALLDPRDYICMTHRRPINRLGLIKFVRANLSEKDWDAFVEIYGIPAVFVIGPERVPEGKEDEYKEAAENAASGGSGYLPFGSTVSSANEARGVQPFAERLEWLSKKLVLAGTGGMLTMLAESGSGTLAGGAHAETFAAIARARAAKISEVLQRSIDSEVLEAAFPGRPRLAYFDIAAEEERDVGEIVDHAVKIRAALPGHQMDPEDLAERTGYKLIPVATTATEPLSPEEAARQEQLGHRRAMHRESGLLGGDRDATVEALSERTEDKLMSTARESLARAMADDLSPVRARIEQALALEDDQAMLDELSRINAELPALLVEICKNPKAEAAMEEALTAALFNGIAAGAARHASEVQS